MIITFLLASLMITCVIITLLLWEILKELARMSGVILALSKYVCNRKSEDAISREGEKRKTGMLKKRIDKPFRMVWLDDELNEIGSEQTDYGAKMKG